MTYYQKVEDRREAAMSNWNYWQRVTIQGEDVGILRMNSDCTEEVWTGQSWVSTTAVSRAMFGGDPLLDKITAAKARKLYPAAFETED